MALLARPRDMSKFLTDMKADLAQGLIPLSVFGDPEIYQLELQRIFGRSWVFIGHETELPKPGDFALRYIGEDPYLFVHDSSGTIRVFLNACRHRGTQFCRVERGNSKVFTCPYHGWTYQNDGRLISVPARSDGYRQLNFADWGLFAAPKVESYCGLIFANLDPRAGSLQDYLGQFRWYLDIQFLLTEGGMEVIGEPHRWLTTSNWKQPAENFCGDSSHTQIVHRSAFTAGAAGLEAIGAPGKTYGLHVTECDGHAIGMRLLEKAGETGFWSYPPELTAKFSTARLSEAQIDLARRAIGHDGTVFPNFSFLHVALSDSKERSSAGFLTLRLWQPKGPDKTEIWSWILCPKEASEAYRRRAYRVGMSSFSPSGSFESDDVAVFGTISRSAKTAFARSHHVKLNYQMGLGGMTEERPVADFPGPGIVFASNAGEGGLRTFHNSWLRQMTNGGDE